MVNETQQTHDGVNFSVHNIYLKDVSFEAPNSPHIFSHEWKPKMDFDMEMDNTKLSEEVFETVLHVRVTIKLDIAKNKDKPEEKENVAAFLVEVKQGGVFSLHGISDEARISQILSTVAASVLFPYVRETVSSLVTKGAFPQLILPPMNFEAMYKKHLEDKAKAEQEQQKSEK